MNTEEALNILKKIIDISSPYSPIPDSDLENNKKAMIEEISNIENNSTILNGEVHYYLGLAYRNFCAWFIRGENRIDFLKKVVEHLEKSVSMNNDLLESKIELARILIEESKVRNLDMALQIIDELKLSNSVPSWMDSIIAKAKRWTDDIVLPVDCNFSNLDPTPAVFREERTKLRKLLTDFQKTNESAQQIVAKRLYNLGLFVAYLYDSHDCNTGVIGFQYDNAVKVAKKVSTKFCFDYLGKIEKAFFLSDSDYKKIEKSLGESKNMMPVSKVKELI